jgi:ABC-2 type transport system permease protein
VIIMAKLLIDSGLMFGRSLRDARRRAPVVFLAPTLLAVLIVLLFDGIYGNIARTEEYPGDFIDWVAPAAVFLSVFLGAGSTAASLISDLRSGYLDRLRLLSIAPAAMIVGRAAFDAIRAVPPAAAVFGVSLLLGASHRNGAAGLLGILALCCALAVAWNGIFYAAALVTVNPAVIQGLQPVTFMPAVMFSTFWVPAALMPGWYRWISDHNPATPIIDTGRSIMLGATDWDRLVTCAIVLACIAALTYSVAGRQLSRLLRGI